MNISSATENLMTHIIILNKGIKCHISPDIIYKNKPVDYTLNIVKKYYDSLAILNYNVGVLGYYNIQTNLYCYANIYILILLLITTFLLCVKLHLSE